MTKAVYVVAAHRSAVTKAHRGALATMRPDDMLAQLMRQMLHKQPCPPDSIDDVIIGCATPEAEQGMNIARMSTLLAGLPDTVPGFTINRFCASGLESIALAAAKIQSNQAHLVIAGGVESMSLLPFGGHHLRPNPRLFTDGPDLYPASYSMGITAEAIAREYAITRQAQDTFALASHEKAIAAIDNKQFHKEILPLHHTLSHPAGEGTALEKTTTTIDADSGPRRDTSLEALARLKPVFAKAGSVTAGNSSQISDGAAVLLLADEAAILRYDLTPIARFCGYKVAGLAPEYMGMGPVYAIPNACKAAGISLQDIEHIELNEAFAAQALAVIEALSINPKVINPFGGAIALGHPLGATGAIKTVTMLHNLQAQSYRYGMTTMCIGTGMGAAGIFSHIKAG